jgi:hypothetical protein
MTLEGQNTLWPHSDGFRYAMKNRSVIEIQQNIYRVERRLVEASTSTKVVESKSSKPDLCGLIRAAHRGRIRITNMRSACI